MRKLLWKEWHEQSWKLGFTCLVLGAVALIGLRSRVIADESLIKTVCVLGFFLPLLASPGLLPAERGEGTLEMLMSLPISRKKILLAKILIGILLTTGPLIAALIISEIIAGGRELSAVDIGLLYLCAIVTALSLLFWMMAITARMPSETRAGLLGMGVIVFWLLATDGLVHTDGVRSFIPISPFAFGYQMAQHAPAGTFVEIAVVQILIVAGLCFWTDRALSSEQEAE